MKWATSDDLGVIAFARKMDAKARYPSCRFFECEFAMGFRGWIAYDPYGSDNAGTVKTPDGREIPVVSGYSSEHGRLIGMRGANVRSRYAEAWRAIMIRVVDAGLELSNYRHTQEVSP